MAVIKRYTGFLSVVFVVRKQTPLVHVQHIQGDSDPSFSNLLSYGITHHDITSSHGLVLSFQYLRS